MAEATSAQLDKFKKLRNCPAKDSRWPVLASRRRADDDGRAELAERGLDIVGRNQKRRHRKSRLLQLDQPFRLSSPASRRGS